MTKEKVKKKIKIIYISTSQAEQIKNFSIFSLGP